MIFVDTGAWFASVVPWDDDHAAVTAWLRHNTEPLLTTDYVVDETLTLVRVRGEPARALALGHHFFAGAVAQVHFLTPDELLAAWDVFRRFSDKEWSFTDCTSKVVIEGAGIPVALALDQHFHQFGSVAVVP